MIERWTKTCTDVSDICVCLQGFHLSRRQLNVLPNPEEAYARRGAPWTFNGGAFYQAVLHLRETGGPSEKSLLRLL